MKENKARLNMRATLILYALIPLISAALVLSIVLINKSSTEMKKWTNDSLLQVATQTGKAFDDATKTNEIILKSFATSPVVVDYLKDPANEELAARAQQYTVDYFSSLEGWEGLYIADWDTTVMTHSTVSAIIGKVLREGDARDSLHDLMLGAKNGVYNTGIMTSPSSGEIVMSLYCPVFDENGTPIGYVGSGTFVNNEAAKLSDVSGLGKTSAYIYYVDNVGTMLYHPNPDKIGQPVENAAVKSLVAKLEAGESPAPDCIVYEYKGAVKYAAYYIGKDDAYILVLTADEKDVLSGITAIKTWTILITLLSVVLFATIAILIAQVIAKPLISVAKSIEKLGTGDVTADCDASSHIKETVNIIASFKKLKVALSDSIGAVKTSADILSQSIVSVDDKTGSNVEAITQINNAIGEVSTTSQSVAESAQVMAEKAIDLGNSIENLNGNVQSLYDESQVIKEANNEATERMGAVYTGANESVDAMKNIGDKIAETNGAIEDIGKAVQAIESIASQTNLLSLNASIEAARAGEAGRGFAVVADEIRSLADSSAQSAKEIKQIIENVVALSNETVDISSKVFEVINRERTDIEQAQEKFEVLYGSVEKSIAEIETIKSLSGELDAIKAELSNATTDLGAISEELGASAQEVAASCQVAAQASSDTQGETAQMRSANDEMNKAIGYFKL